MTAESHWHQHGHPLAADPIMAGLRRQLLSIGEDEEEEEPMFKVTFGEDWL